MVLSSAGSPAQSTERQADTMTDGMAVLTAEEALTVAQSAARAAVGRHGIRANDASDDIASAALTVCLTTGGLTIKQIRATVRIVARNYAVGRNGITYGDGSAAERAALAISADRIDGDGGSLADTFADTPEEPDGDPVRIERRFSNGAVLAVYRDNHGIDPATAVLYHPSLGGVEATGPDALAAGHRMALAESVKHAGNFGQTVAALTRDQAVLSFVGSAADAVAAGLARNAGAWRAALCAARKRQAGGSAHSAAI